MSLPANMNCIEITNSGEPSVLQMSKRPIPIPKNGEVLIKITAAGVNRPDCLQRQGLYAPPPGATDIPGLEAAGEIIATGVNTTRFKIGDHVTALLTGGGYAEYVTTPEDLCLKSLANLDATQNAALPETFFTVWGNVFDRTKLQPGETFLIHGGTSGIGTTAIQLATQMGARVMTTAGSVEKCQACIDLGAEVAVPYKTQDFVTAAKEFGGGKGVDVILDMVGGDYLARNIKSLAPDGRLVNIAFLKGSTAEINFMPIMLKRLTITGSTLRPQTTEAKAKIRQSLEKTVWPLLETGKIHPVIHKTFPLGEAADAHRLMESSKHIGKIMLQI